MPRFRGPKRTSVFTSLRIDTETNWQFQPTSCRLPKPFDWKDNVTRYDGLTVCLYWIWNSISAVWSRTANENKQTEKTPYWVLRPICCDRKKNRSGFHSTIEVFKRGQRLLWTLFTVSREAWKCHWYSHDISHHTPLHLPSPERNNPKVSTCTHVHTYTLACMPRFSHKFYWA